MEKHPDFQRKLADLVSGIEDLPAENQRQLERLVTETQDRHHRMRETVKELTETLDYLRLSVKYLVFDLEATRRENKYLRKMIERLNGR